MLQQLNTPKPRGLKQRQLLKTLPSATPLGRTPGLQKRIIPQTIKKTFKVYQEEQEISHPSTEDCLNYGPEEVFEIDNQKVYPKFNFMTEQEKQVLEEINSGRVEFLKVDLMPPPSPEKGLEDLDFKFDDKEFQSLF